MLTHTSPTYFLESRDPLVMTMCKCILSVRPWLSRYISASGFVALLRVVDTFFLQITSFPSTSVAFMPHSITDWPQIYKGCYWANNVMYTPFAETVGDLSSTVRILRSNLLCCTKLNRILPQGSWRWSVQNKARLILWLHHQWGTLPSLGMNWPMPNSFLCCVRQTLLPSGLLGVIIHLKYNTWIHTFSPTLVLMKLMIYFCLLDLNHWCACYGTAEMEL